MRAQAILHARVRQAIVSTMKLIIEIRPAEGGADSKLLAADLMAAYVRLFQRFT